MNSFRQFLTAGFFLFFCHKVRGETLRRWYVEAETWEEALPEKWQKGEVKGLVARGAFVVDIAWERHVCRSIRIYAQRGGTCTLCYQNRSICMQTRKNKVYDFTVEGENIRCTGVSAPHTQKSKSSKAQTGGKTDSL